LLVASIGVLNPVHTVHDQKETLFRATREDSTVTIGAGAGTNGGQGVDQGANSLRTLPGYLRSACPMAKVRIRAGYLPPQEHPCTSRASRPSLTPNKHQGRLLPPDQTILPLMALGIGLDGLILVFRAHLDRPLGLLSHSGPTRITHCDISRTYIAQESQYSGKEALKCPKPQNHTVTTHTSDTSQQGWTSGHETWVRSSNTTPSSDPPDNTGIHHGAHRCQVRENTLFHWIHIPPLLPWARYHDLLRRKPVTRIGGASHPGPIINMPGDGHCLYHALGWWANKSHIEMREILSNIADDLWHQICPWDTGPALRTYRADTRDTTQWGTALQIAACAKMFGNQIIVHTPFGPQTLAKGLHGT